MEPLYIALCIAVLVITYLLNITYMSVFYHRAFTHNAIALHPWLRRFVIWTGPWLTGMDIKGWACMHRLHHEHSDKEGDPHSPVNVGFFGVMLEQARNYTRIMGELVKGDKAHTELVADLDFPISWSQRRGIWWLPYALHVIVGVSIALAFGTWLLAIAYLLGVFSHPVQGWMINSFGHARGYRNFERDDNSRNNYPTAFFILGEGFQNNHHAYPASARFSARAWEIDFGYWICNFLHFVRLARIDRRGLIPRGT